MESIVYTWDSNDMFIEIIKVILQRTIKKTCHFEINEKWSFDSTSSYNFFNYIRILIGIFFSKTRKQLHSMNTKESFIIHIKQLRTIALF